MLLILGSSQLIQAVNMYRYVCDQIQIDLLRTLPNNRHYENFDSDGIAGLRNVLLAFATHNPEVGYCQVVLHSSVSSNSECNKQIYCITQLTH